MDIVCICRCIYAEDYPDPEVLRLRILRTDFKCGQCQLRYLLDTTVNSSQGEFTCQDSANSV